MTKDIVKLGETLLPKDHPVYLIRVFKKPKVATDGVNLVNRTRSGADGNDVGRYHSLYYSLVGDYPIYASKIGHGVIIAGEGSQYLAYRNGAEAVQIKAHEGVSILEKLREEDEKGPGVALLPGDQGDDAPPAKGHLTLQRYLE